MSQLHPGVAGVKKGFPALQGAINGQTAGRQQCAKSFEGYEACGTHELAPQSWQPNQVARHTHGSMCAWQNI